MYMQSNRYGHMLKETFGNFKKFWVKFICIYPMILFAQKRDRMDGFATGLFSLNLHIKGFLSSSLRCESDGQ